MQRHDDASCSFTDARDLWAPTPATTFMVRSLDYARTKQKVNSSEAIYRLVAVDLFSFQKKQTHVAQLVQLPAPAPQRHVSAPDTYLPPLLVVNIMLPMYAVSTKRLSVWRELHAGALCSQWLASMRMGSMAWEPLLPHMCIFLDVSTHAFLHACTRAFTPCMHAPLAAAHSLPSLVAPTTAPATPSSTTLPCLRTLTHIHSPTLKPWGC